MRGSYNFEEQPVSEFIAQNRALYKPILYTDSSILVTSSILFNVCSTNDFTGYVLPIAC